MCKIDKRAYLIPEKNACFCECFQIYPDSIDKKRAY